MSAGRDSDGRAAESLRRREAALIGAYHDEPLRVLLEHVRTGARLDAGEIDAFELDDLIHHYKCGARVVEVLRLVWIEAVRAVRTLALLRDSGDRIELLASRRAWRSALTHRDRTSGGQR